MRRVELLVLSLALVAPFTLTAGGPPATAADHPRVSVSSAEGHQGEQVTVSIAGDSGGETFGAWSFDLAFDAAVVSAVDCSSAVGLCSVESGEAAVRVAGISLSGLSGEVEFATVSFELVGEPGSESVLALRLRELANALMEDIAPVTEVTDGMVTVIQEPGPPVAVKGDADCDGGVDAVDGLMVLNSVVGNGGADCAEAADVNCDGGLSAVDALLILRFVAGLAVGQPPGCTPVGT